MENVKEIDFVNKSKLDNGLRIVTEHIESVKSVSVGIWVKTGGRNETEKQAGITHFLEHMLFKGTDSRSSYDIALSMEAVGGYLNAFTSSEYTCYYARCLNTQLDRALDVLSDMVLHPSFPEEEVEKEKKVVIEEMNFKKHVLLSEIERVLSNKELYSNMVDNAKNFYDDDAAEQIARAITNIALQHEAQ
jgi:predicted Zn-dependent peptidase